MTRLNYTKKALLLATAFLPLLGVFVSIPLAKSQRPANVDLSKVTIVLGDQVNGTRALVEAAKVLEGVPYKYKWASFQGAAPLFEALRAGAVDTAPAGDLPVITAALGQTPLKILATRVGNGESLGIVVRGDSPIKRVADLKGKTVVVSSARGSVSQYQLYGALAEAGLKRSDVTVKFVLPTDASAAFLSKAIEVWAVFDPYYYVAQQNGGRVLRDGKGINSALSFVTASDNALADPGKRAAIADFLKRLSKATDWAIANPDAYAQVHSNLTRLPLSTSKVITRRGARKLRPVTNEDISKLQTVADRSVQYEILPKRIDVRTIVDQNVWKN
ncbi:ABC transporter substrate-binding protein [Tolypothrix sp. PCC 7910]|uniref:ABC transporter substrate-binding protein n=1 Tax=Tolypothrix sp. PCC 7910 TaxID=2099387 RepID=UPI00142797E5|nr:ABC transporter substrate-binding protein [Tolypothrix sp. PCC 7910]QIR35907.1 ABC transporter substrate-binding protein [Tolypothrix sp. PCC 7910]